VSAGKCAAIGQNKGLMDKMQKVVALIALLCHSLIVHAGGTHGGIEHQVKAAFLYKFAGYVEWPETVFSAPDENFHIGVVSADDVADELVRLSDSIRINERSVSIKRFSATDQVSGVQMLFVGRQAEQQLQTILQQVDSAPVLTVTESEGALASGSIINFVPVDDYIRFEISIARANLCDIKISARLLNVALNIQKRS
jgi:hypothetical protein